VSVRCQAEAALGGVGARASVEVQCRFAAAVGHPPLLRHCRTAAPSSLANPNTTTR
jgi:hypothetical protein